MEEVKQSIVDATAMRSQLNANLEYHTVCKERDHLENRVSNILKIMNEGKSIDTIEVELDETNVERNNAYGELNRLRGSAEVISADGQAANRELKSKKFKKIDKRHRETLIKKETTDMTIKDLDKYDIQLYIFA